MAQPEPRSVDDPGETTPGLRGLPLPDSSPQLPWPQSRAEFATFVETYAQRLARYAFRLLGNRQDAEDVVQEVFVRAFSDRSKRTEITAVGPYLYRAVANACTDVLRKRGRGRCFAKKWTCRNFWASLRGPARPLKRSRRGGGLRPCLAVCPRTRPRRSACGSSMSCD